MIEITKKSSEIMINNSSKKQVIFNTSTLWVNVDWYDIDCSGEYEKSSILLEVKEYNQILFYNFLIDSKRVIIITHDDFELTEEILSFFWDVDVLIIIWTKNAIKIFEKIEAKLVIPYWEWKDLFLNTLWQNIDEVESYKVKTDFLLNTTEFVNLKD